MMWVHHSHTQTAALAEVLGVLESVGKLPKEDAAAAGGAAKPSAAFAAGSAAGTAKVASRVLTWKSVKAVGAAFWVCNT